MAGQVKGLARHFGHRRATKAPGMLKLRINYRFGWGAAPVTARYQLFPMEQTWPRHRPGLFVACTELVTRTQFLDSITGGNFDFGPPIFVRLQRRATPLGSVNVICSLGRWPRGQ
jgi:hypothetical protein